VLASRRRCRGETNLLWTRPTARAALRQPVERVQLSDSAPAPLDRPSRTFLPPRAPHLRLHLPRRPSSASPHPTPLSKADRARPAPLDLQLVMATAAAAPPVNLGHLQWRSPEYLLTTGGSLQTAEQALDYFSYSPFFDKRSNNATLRMQMMFANGGMHGVDEERELRCVELASPPLSLGAAAAQSVHELTPACGPPRRRRLTGLEFAVSPLSRPQDDLFIVVKRQRSSPDDATDLGAFYILNGNVYQAPSLFEVVNERMVRPTASLVPARSLERFPGLTRSSPRTAHLDQRPVDLFLGPHGPQTRLDPAARRRVGDQAPSRRRRLARRRFRRRHRRASPASRRRRTTARRRRARSGRGRGQRRPRPQGGPGRRRAARRRVQPAPVPGPAGDGGEDGDRGDAGGAGSVRRVVESDRAEGASLVLVLDHRLRAATRSSSSRDLF